MCVSSLSKKVFSTSSTKFFFFRPQTTRHSFACCNVDLREEGSQCQRKTFPKTFFALEVLSMYLPEVRKIFSTATVKFSALSLVLKIQVFFRFC